MRQMKKACRALIAALVISVTCSFIAFGDEGMANESAVESSMDDTADNSSVESADSVESDDASDEKMEDSNDSAQDTDNGESESEEDDDQSSFDSGNKEDHSSFDEWDVPTPEPEPEPEPEPVTPEPLPTPEPEKPVVVTPEEPVTPEPLPTPEPEKPVVIIPEEPTPLPTPQPEKPVVVVPEEPTPEQPEKPELPKHHDHDDDHDVVIVVPENPVPAIQLTDIPEIEVYQPADGQPELPEAPEIVVEKPSDSSTTTELPKTGDSSLALIAFIASAAGLVALGVSGFVNKSHVDETTKKNCNVSANVPQNITLKQEWCAEDVDLSAPLHNIPFNHLVSNWHQKKDCAIVLAPRKEGLFLFVFLKHTNASK